MLASTSEVYGDPLEHPQKETYWGNVNPVGPRGVYDEAKRFAEAMTMAYHRYHGVDAKIVRIFNTYGPRMRVNDGRAVPAFMSQALRNEDVTIFGDGSQTRSFCYVTDLVDGIIRLMQSDLNEPVNIGNPHEMTIEEIAETIIRMTGSHEPARLPAAARRRPEGAPARHHAGADAARLGTEGLARGGPREDHRVLPQEGAGVADAARPRYADRLRAPSAGSAASSGAATVARRSGPRTLGGQQVVQGAEHRDGRRGDDRRTPGSATARPR